MYKFPYYTEENQQAVIEFMKKNSFAVIIGIAETYPVATHIPLEVDVDSAGKIFLSGHIMKKTDHHIAFEKNNNVLVIFNGPHTHVSASWYSNPAVGSTWDYMAVHAKGKIIFTDESGTIDVIKRITDKYEGLDKSSSFSKLSEEYIQQMAKAIVGFSIEVETLENTFKLSQNKDEESKRNIIEQLMKRGDDNSKAIAKEILSRLMD